MSNGNGPEETVLSTLHHALRVPATGTQNTQNVAALKRARDQDLAVHPGQDTSTWSSTMRRPREGGSRWPTKR